MGLIGRAWVVLLLGGLATYAVRASFLLAARRFERVPAWATDALRMIPAAALAALTLPALLRPAGTLAPLAPEALAGAAALVAAWWTRSVLLTIVVGMAVVVGFDRLLG